MAKDNGDFEKEKSYNPLAVMSREEMDVQIATAKRFPRSIVEFKRMAEEMATLDEETAASMFYVLPRAGKRIEGPSVRLAEIVGSAWGNVRYDGRVVEVQERYVIAQGTCLDLERNTGARVEVRRRITNKDGRRYDDDMIGVTANAAVSIALRQCIFKVVPFAYIKSIYEKSKEVAVGKGLTMEQRRNRAMEWFGKVGAKPEDLFKILERKGLEDLTVDDLIALQGMKNAIMEGETTWEKMWRDFNAESEAPEEKKGPAMSKLKETLKAEVAPKPEPPAEPEQPEAKREEPEQGPTPMQVLIDDINSLSTPTGIMEMSRQLNKRLKTAGVTTPEDIVKVSSVFNQKREEIFGKAELPEIKKDAPGARPV